MGPSDFFNFNSHAKEGRQHEANNENMWHFHRTTYFCVRREQRLRPQKTRLGTCNEVFFYKAPTISLSWCKEWFLVNHRHGAFFLGKWLSRTRNRQSIPNHICAKASHIANTSFGGVFCFYRIGFSCQEVCLPNQFPRLLSTKYLAIGKEMSKT